MNEFSLKTTAAAPAISAPQLSSPLKPGQTAGQLPADFKDLLAVLVLGLGMPGNSQGDFSFGAQIAPLMASLLEQLLAQQVEAEPSAEPAEPDSATTYLAATAPAGLPLAGRLRLTQGYHGGHQALDFGVPVGTPVHSTLSGKVVHAGWNDEGYGNLVIVANGPYRAYYAHLSEIPVSLGQFVQAGAVIGLSGNTGNSTGPHLHYEVRVNGQEVDPRTIQLPFQLG
jgi:murein DD-endopeptidase MepM/ murein hydrolase activator NlpD